MGRKRKNQWLLDLALHDPIRKKYHLSVLFADENKSPGIRKWDKWRDKQQNEFIIKKLCKPNHTCYGYLGGSGDGLQFIDFDAYWVYRQAIEELGETLNTRTIKTPNGGFHTLFISKTPTTNVDYKSSLKLEIFGNYNCIVDGVAKALDGELHPYELVRDIDIVEDDNIVATILDFAKKLLTKYPFLTYKCISNKLEKKINHLTHEQRLHIANLFYQHGADDELLVDFFRMCSDFNEKITLTQLKYTKKKIENGNLKFPTCHTLKKEFGCSESDCEECGRRFDGQIKDTKKDTRSSKKGKKAEHPEANFTPADLQSVLANQQKSITHGMHYDDEEGIIFTTRLEGLYNFYGCSKENYIIATENIDDINPSVNAKVYTIKGYTSNLTDRTQKAVIELATEIHSSNELKAMTLAELYDWLLAKVQYYIEFRDIAEYHLYVLWVIGTYYRVIWSWFPYITFFGLRDVGKSTALTLLSHLAYNGGGYVTSFSTESLLLRKAASTKGIIFVDHYEEIRHNQEKRQIYNLFMENSWRLNATVEKVNPNTFELEVFNIPCSVAIGTRYSDDVLEEKGIQITMYDTTNNELRRRSRLLDSDPDFEDVQKMCISTVLSEQERVKTFYENPPQIEGLYGRDWNKFMPLVALAQAVDSLNDRKYNLFQKITQYAVNYRQTRKEDVTDYEEVLLKIILEYGIESATYPELSKLMNKEGYPHYGWRTCQADIKKLGILHFVNRKNSPVIAHFKLDIAKQRAEQRGIDWEPLPSGVIAERVGGHNGIEDIEIVDPELVEEVSIAVLERMGDDPVDIKDVYKLIKEKYKINRQEFEWVLSVMKEQKQIIKARGVIKKR